jgi:hypothetical protein
VHRLDGESGEHARPRKEKFRQSGQTHRRRRRTPKTMCCMVNTRGLRLPTSKCESEREGGSDSGR